MKRLTEGLIHKNIVIISGARGVGPINPLHKGRGDWGEGRAIFKGGTPSLKYGPVPSTHCPILLPPLPFPFSFR